MIRFLLFAFIFYAVYRLLKSWGASLLRPEPQDARDGESLEAAELIQDPECGVYFLKQRGLPARIQGRTFHFCSEACRSAYLKKHKLR